MKYALFPGCTAKSEQYACELSAREVFPRLGIEIVDLQGANCCGYPVSVTSPLSWTYMAARNMALAEKRGAGLLPLCNSCHLSFCEIQRDLSGNPDQKGLVNDHLSSEGLSYSGELEVTHILEALHDEIGVKRIKEKVVKPLENLNLAAHPGCHAFRPRTLKRPDDSENPRKLDHLIKALGAKASDYPEKLTCCGSYLSLHDEKAALKLAGLKLKAVKEEGLDGLVTTCPMCFKIFEGKQRAIKTLIDDKTMDVPVVYYTQLLGLAMGIPPEKLGLHLNLTPVERLLA